MALSTGLERGNAAICCCCCSYGTHDASEGRGVESTRAGAIKKGILRVLTLGLAMARWHPLKKVCQAARRALECGGVQSSPCLQASGSVGGLLPTAGLGEEEASPSAVLARQPTSETLCGSLGKGTRFRPCQQCCHNRAGLTQQNIPRKWWEPRPGPPPAGGTQVASVAPGCGDWFSNIDHLWQGHVSSWD